jgi:hypothetical protein
MSVAEAVQTTAKPQSSAASGLLLQRKCACGGSAGFTGECSDCRTNKLLGKPLQAKLRISAPGDEYEQEADRVAEQIMHMAEPGKETGASTTTEAVPLVQRKVSASGGGVGTAPPLVHDVLASPGHPLDSATRAFFEPRFGHDFGYVRVHADAKAAESAQAINALAYTVGRHIVFAPDIHSQTANEVLAHELVHVLQETEQQDRTLRRRRRTLDIDGFQLRLSANSLADIPTEKWTSEVTSLYQKFAGTPLTDSMAEDFAGLTHEAQYWVLQAIYLLIDNKTIRKTIPYDEAVQRLLVYAPSAEYHPMTTPDEPFAREVLSASGWLEHVAEQRLLAPEEETKAEIETIVNPPTGEATLGNLDVEELRRRLYPALNHFLSSSKSESANWGRPETRSLSHIQDIADTMFHQAREYFSPFADTAVVDLARLEGWRPSERIYSVTDKLPGKQDRYDLLLNRAEVVGRNTDGENPKFSDTNIFQDVNFDATNAEHKNTMNSILLEWADESSDLKEILDRVIRHTAETRGIAVGTDGYTRIGLSTEYDASKETACEANWNGINSFCHEMLHALGNPDFLEKKLEIGHGQIVSEGFTEVLGVQLFNDHVVKKAAMAPEFKAKLELGVSGAPCPSPTSVTIGYGEAGRAAEQIRQKIGDERFRAAYFLGKPELAGLPE